MSNPYVVEKQRVTVQALLPNRAVESLSIFLEPNALRDSGYCRPSELFERPETFLSVLDASGAVSFLSRDAVMALAVPAHLEDPDSDIRLEEHQGAARQDVEVCFEDGTRLRGTLIYVLPDNKNRIQDYLLQDSACIRMWSKGSIYIVNKKRVVSVRPLEMQNGVASAWPTSTS
jgi:hypothetical protein